MKVISMFLSLFITLSVSAEPQSYLLNCGFGDKRKALINLPSEISSDNYIIGTRTTGEFKSCYFRPKHGSEVVSDGLETYKINSPSRNKNNTYMTQEIFNLPLNWPEAREQCVGILRRALKKEDSSKEILGFYLQSNSGKNIFMKINSKFQPTRLQIYANGSVIEECTVLK